MISSCPDYLHADVSDGQDVSCHQQKVTDGQIVTMSLVPGTVDSDVDRSVTFADPPLYLQRRCPPWTAAENLVTRHLNWKKEKRKR